MVSKNKIDNKQTMEKLTKETQLIIDDFLKHYKKSSTVNYISAIANMFYLLGKKDVKDLVFDDLARTQDYFRTKSYKSKYDSHIETFYKYLYAFNLLETNGGFDKIWIKEDWINYFNNKLKNKKDNIKYKPTLTVSEIRKIQEIVDFEYSIDQIDMLKISFIWYILFHTECGVEELVKGIDGNSLVGNKIVTKFQNEYDIPSKYIILFNYLKDRTKSGFFNSNEILMKLASIVNLNKLTPMMIKKARKENLINCCMCGNSYLNSTDNWVAINNRIICKRCAEELKKNDNLEMVELTNENIIQNNPNNDVDISSIIHTYDQLKERLNKNIDYLKLHKFQIEIGKLGEAYVFDMEKRKLLNSPYLDKIDNTPAKDSTNGYDILSYDENGNKIYIEVKTESGENHDFYITSNELDTAKKLNKDGERYYIYRVHNILAKDKKDIKIDVITDILKDDRYSFEICTWKVIKKS